MNDLPLFAQPTSADRKAALQRLQERLEPRIIDLALRAGPEGIIAGDVIAAAIADWAIWTGEEWRKNPRAYSMVGPFLSALARRSILLPKLVGGYHVSRKSDRDHSHGNKNLIYVHPQHAEERRGVA